MEGTRQYSAADQLREMLEVGSWVSETAGSVREGGRKVAEARGDMPFRALLGEPLVIGSLKAIKGARITGCLHVTPQTAVLVETLSQELPKHLELQIRWSACNVDSTSDSVARYLVSTAQVPLFAKRGESLLQYWLCIAASLMFKSGSGYVGPTSLIDDGGDATLFLIEGYLMNRGLIEEADKLGFVHSDSHETRIRRDVIKIVSEMQPDFFDLPDFRGVSEETTTGIARARALIDVDLLKFPVVNVNGSAVKSKFDNLYGSRESVVDAIQRSTRVMLGGKVVVVLGYGSVGKGVAQAFRGQGCRVIVTEVDPICALQALMEGYEVTTMARLLDRGEGDVFITTTGCCDVITVEHVRKMKNGAILANAGHFNSEIAVDEMNKMFEHEEVALGITEYVISCDPQKLGIKVPAKKVKVLAQGRLVNLVNAEGHPSMVMSCSMAVQLLGQLCLYGEILRSGYVCGLGTIIDEQVAHVHLAFLGGHVEKLSEQQATYLGIPQQGPFKDEYYRY